MKRKKVLIGLKGLIVYSVLIYLYVLWVYFIMTMYVDFKRLDDRDIINVVNTVIMSVLCLKNYWEYLCSYFKQLKNKQKRRKRSNEKV